MLPIALRAAEILAHTLPSRVLYALADLAGDAWHRFATRRRRLVRANLGRVRGAPVDAALVRQAFREHARYYLEMLRVPHYDVRRVDRHISVADWPALEPVFRSGPVVMVTAHLGNFEPFGHWFAAHGLRAVVPVEETQPRELFEFLLARRGGNRAVVEAIPLSKARHRLVVALRGGEVVALVADRDIQGDGLAVSLFGHPTTVPMGPAALALLTGARVVTGRSLRAGRDRFEIRGEVVDCPPTGDRRADVATLTSAITERLERYIRERPEQWFGAFQPIWADIPA